MNVSWTEYYHSHALGCWYSQKNVIICIKKRNHFTSVRNTLEVFRTAYSMFVIPSKETHSIQAGKTLSQHSLFNALAYLINNITCVYLMFLVLLKVRAWTSSSVGTSINDKFTLVVKDPSGFQGVHVLTIRLQGSLVHCLCCVCSSHQISVAYKVHCSI